MLDWTRTVVLLATLAVAVYQDVRWRKITNRLILVAAGTTVLVALMQDGINGLGDALLGGILGFLCFIPLYLLQVMGAGDVKLMAVVGMLVGPDQILPAVLAVLVAGGVFALVVAIHQHRLGQLRKNLQDMASGLLLRLTGLENLASVRRQQLTVAQMPYAVAIATGTLFWVFG